MRISLFLRAIVAAPARSTARRTRRTTCSCARDREGAPSHCVGWAKSPAIPLSGGHGACAILPTRNQPTARLCPPYTLSALGTGERAFDRFERRLGLGAVGTAGLRHIRPPAA